ncbi:MAG: selenite/tellurite reduction operon c-type cytochrome lipoprotein ExtS [Syntrophales bacterium]
MGVHRTILIVFAVVLFLPGFAVPAGRNSCFVCHGSHYAVQGGCVGCHRGNDRTDRKEIAHHDLIIGRFAHFTMKGSPVVKRGKKLVEALACRRCHTYGGKGNRLAANLARVAANTAPQGIFDSIKSPVLFMPNFQCDDMQIAALVNAVLVAAEPAGAQTGETAQVVHFEDENQSRENIFVKDCGPCHKSLSERSGGLGNGNIGPNLSGLFSASYPQTYRGAESWTPDKLKKWLENPRTTRANARMKPVRLTVGEFELLMETMRINPG